MKPYQLVLLISLSCLSNLVMASALVNIQLENDTYFGQDQHYTNGITVSYLPLEVRYPKLTACLQDLGFKLDVEDLYVEYAFTNAIYTPEDIEEPQPQPYDHPWAGHSYVGAKLIHKPIQWKNNWKLQQAAELNFGVIGPLAGAKFIQTNFHKLINSRDPKGWHNQYKNEPTANLVYHWQAHQTINIAEDIYLLNQPEIGFSLGSPFTHVNYGWGLGLANAPLPINLPAIAPTGLATSYFNFNNQWVWQFVLGVQQRLVIYNQFLDGQLLHSSPSLEKKHLVNSAYLGWAVSYGKWRLTSKLVHTDKEFKGQEDNNTFATLGVAFFL